MANVPFGGLVSFAGYTFTPNRSTTITDYSLEWVTSVASLPDASFPIDLWYDSPAPLQTPFTASWQYLLLANCDAGAGTQAYTADLENQYSALKSALLSSQKGTLTVESLAGGTVSCTARIKSAAIKSLVPGKNSMFYLLTLTFLLFTDWQ